MKIAIMQPYLFPYIGYFQLIACVDKFVIYDSIEYTKKGWINRNQILMNGAATYFTVPLKKDSDYLSIIEREIAVSRTKDIAKILNKIEAAYRKAPFFREVIPILKVILSNPENNLFGYIKGSIEALLKYLEIHTEIVVASDIQINHSLKSQDKVLAICNALNADNYINPIGGASLYSKEVFSENNIELSFIQTEGIDYDQFDNEHVPWLSIIDVMMFNSKKTIQVYLRSFKLL